MQSPVEVQWVARYDYPSGWGIKRHAHDYCQIIYVLKGAGEFGVGSTARLLQKDMFVFIRPREEHFLNKIHKEEIKTIDIKFTVNSRKLMKSLENAGNVNDGADGRIKVLLEKIREEGRNRPFYYVDMANNLLEEILLLLARMNSGDPVLKNGAGQTDVGPARDMNGITKLIGEYIEKNYAQPLKLDTIALELGYSRNYVCQAFKEGSGCNVLDYIHMVRVQKAKEMIRYSEYDLKQICEQAGFANIHHFGRVFKKYTNSTPGQYRKSEKEGLGRSIFINDKFVIQEYFDKN